MVAKNKNSGKKAKVEVKPVEQVVEAVVEQVVEDVVEPGEGSVQEIVSDETDVSYVSEFADLIKMADEFLVMARSFKSRVSKLEKSVSKERKVLEKKSRGKKRRAHNPDAPPSGFAKPGPVSDELRKFLSLSKGDLIARTEVTKAINKYCKEHSLQNESDRRKILPDTTLKKLLRMKKGDELTFFNLQTYLKVHFPNKEGVYPTGA